ncbi:DUF11 domain-containing protein [Calothrix sp. 336/3]|uniref:DUF11 domain-containing protein n=1 Tax=Calothrix sp. 336/3 TaxID=1337936 RepID=UPI0004E3D5D9|nr:DUF11 domain-containing protein [Calothrix sp. 336/3]AKG22765.1 conserved repeat protein [Calothrix sp. 336/3]
MTSKNLWLGRRSLFFPFFLLSIFTYGVIPSSAQTGIIRNNATAGGDNLGGGTVRSNDVTFIAGQAALQIIKTGDRSAVEPGETVVYRLAVKNTGVEPTSNVSVTDRMPLGVRLIQKSVKGSIGDTNVALTVTVSGRNVTFAAGVGLQPNQTLNIVYAAEVTPDAVRGDGRNLAVARAGNLTSNPASHQLRIRPGILSDCGTIIGRVFVDKNFDGEQQPGEPGVPNAVVYMDDGNRIITDANGMYSLGNVIAGYRSATLDLTSLPGYALAPNKYFIERNSQSRLVKLAPGSMARVNFGVTPAFSEGKR